MSIDSCAALAAANSISKFEIVLSSVLHYNVYFPIRLIVASNKSEQKLNYIMQQLNLLYSIMGL